MILSNITRLINLSIIIIIWACITEILKVFVISYLNIKKPFNLLCVYCIILTCVLMLNYYINGDILVDEMFYKRLEYEENNNFNQ